MKYSIGSILRGQPLSLLISAIIISESKLMLNVYHFTCGITITCIVSAGINDTAAFVYLDQNISADWFVCNKTFRYLLHCGGVLAYGHYFLNNWFTKICFVELNIED